MGREVKFGFYEKVRFVGADPEKSEIAGALCAILRRAQNDDGTWGYAVHVYGRPTCWYCLEEELESTGEFDKRETFYDGSSIRVSQDGRVLDA